ncbi:MAG: STAS domain-containing protein [Tepidisphaeraceae bacterium]
MAKRSQYFTLTQETTVWVIDLHLADDVDTAAFNEINRELIDHWPVDAGARVLVDLSHARYTGSVLLGLLVNIRQRVRAGRGEMAVSGVSVRLAQVFRTSHLDRILPMFATRAEALQSM